MESRKETHFVGVEFADMNNIYSNTAARSRANYQDDAETSKTPNGFIDGFRRARNSTALSDRSSIKGHVYNAKRANANTARSPLNRSLKGRHLQMIAIGGSIGTGLFIGTGQALATSGPLPMLIAFIILGAALFCTLQALGEMAVLFPVAGSFSAFASRFIDPAWGFAMGWNYAMNWLVVMPLEIIAAVSTLDFWDTSVPGQASATIFLVIIIAINLCSVKAFGEAEFCLSALKVAAVIGFVLLGIIIDCAGGQGEGPIGGRYWVDPGATKAGFKGFCNVLVTASFAFSGTELVGLAAAETHNPIKSIPTAVKQVFWRIFLFYIISVLIVGLLVPSNHPDLGMSSTSALASPFVIAILDAGLHGLDSVMNAVILISVLSVANSSLFGSSRTLAALAEQRQAPQCLKYVDRNGRPIVAVGLGSCVGLLSYLSFVGKTGDIFAWLLALSGLSSIFTWGTICLCHIRFRKAWALQGHSLDELSYRSPVGVIGSWVAVISLTLVLIAQFWVAIDPIGDDSLGSDSLDLTTRIANFFEAFLAFPVVVLFFIGFKLYYKTAWVTIDKIDLTSGKIDGGLGKFHVLGREEKETMPLWKKVYGMLC